MVWAWAIAGLAVGIGLGVTIGRLLAAVVKNWEGAAAAAKATTSLIVFLLGGGAGVAIINFMTHQSMALPMYGTGLGLGLCIAWVEPRIPSQEMLNQDTVVRVLKLSEGLRATVADVDQRAALILATLFPPKILQKRPGTRKEEFARKIEGATDKVAEQGLRGGDKP